MGCQGEVVGLRGKVGDVFGPGAAIGRLVITALIDDLAPVEQLLLQDRILVIYKDAHQQCAHLKNCECHETEEVAFRADGVRLDDEVMQAELEDAG